MDKFFIIPFKKKHLICKINNLEIIEVSSIPSYHYSKSIVVNNSFVVRIDKAIWIYTIDGILIRKLSVDFKLKCINSKENIVYLGGETVFIDNKVGEIVAYFNLDKDEIDIVKLKIPIDITYGKSIDDILILDNRLILVDNIVFPKYLIEYDVSKPSTPIHFKTIELENNGTYEHIIKGDINRNWLVLFSSCNGMGGTSQHIVISGKKKGTLEVFQNRFLFDNVTEKLVHDNNIFKDIALVNNNLFVIRGVSLYVLDLKKSIKLTSLKYIHTDLKVAHRIIKTPCNNVIVIGRSKYEFVKAFCS